MKPLLPNYGTGGCSVVEVSMISSGKIGIVTVTYNSEPVLREFFESLAKQTLRSFVVYAVDNASADNTLDILERQSDVSVVTIANPDNRGVAEGNNQGIRAALADGCSSILLLNNDVVFPANLLSCLSEGLEREHCSAVAPKIYYHDQPDLIWAAGGYFQFWLGRSLHYGEGERDRGQFDTVRKITYAPTCCVLLRAEIFDTVGLMDPRYFVYWDDVDFMYRMKRTGLVMKYLPACRMWHKVGSLTSAAPSQFCVRYVTRNRIYFVRKFLPGLLAGSWIALYRLYLFTRYLLGKDSRSQWKLKETAVADGVVLARELCPASRGI